MSSDTELSDRRHRKDKIILHGEEETIVGPMGRKRRNTDSSLHLMPRLQEDIPPKGEEMVLERRNSIQLKRKRSSLVTIFRKPSKKEQSSARKIQALARGFLTRKRLSECSGNLIFFFFLKYTILILYFIFFF